MTASRVEDFGLQAILERMNSLITPLISGPFWDISNIFQKLDLDFGMPDPYPKDGTGRFAHVGRTCVAHV